MLEALIAFEKLHPGILKRAVVTKLRIVAWTALPAGLVAKLWKSYTDEPLRLIPNHPKEGGLTQIKWNHIWDSATPAQAHRGIRIYS